MHAGAPDVTSRLARQGVIDGSDQDLGAEGEQELEDTVAQIIEIPAGLAQEAVEGAEVFVTAELSSLDDAGEGAAAGAQNPGTGEGPEGAEGRLGKTGFKDEQQRRKGTDQQIRHGATTLLGFLVSFASYRLSWLLTKDIKAKKRAGRN